MHAMIGLMFGPVVWFALLMMTLLVGCFLPSRWLEPVEAIATRLTRPRRPLETTPFATRTPCTGSSTLSAQ
jgi:hypothetical protein